MFHAYAKLNRLIIALILLAAAMVATPPAPAAPASSPAPAAEPAAKLRAKAGAYYFDGWTGQTFHITDRLRTEFAAREPVWGWRDDSPDVMRRQIDYAADAGLAFFSFCWYYPEGAKKETPLNSALELYLKAPNRDRLQFCLLVANHGGYKIGPNEWDAVSRRWIELFKSPAHLKVGDKPLLIIFAPGELVKSFGSAKAVREAFTSLRAMAKAQGIPDVAIAACVRDSQYFKMLEECGYTLFTGYNYPGFGATGTEKKQPFAGMIEGHLKIWDNFVESPLPYIPAVTTGWDMRPWEPAANPPGSMYYPDRTPAEVGRFVSQAVAWLDRHPDKATPDRLIVLYAWNENGEGGYLTPTQSDGTAWLDAVKKALSGGR